MNKKMLCALAAMAAMSGLSVSPARAEDQILGKICIANTSNGAHFESQIIKHGNAYFHRSIDVSGDSHDQRIHFDAKGFFNYPWVTGDKVDAQELFILRKGSVEIRTNEVSGVLKLRVIKGNEDC